VDTVILLDPFLVHTQNLFESRSLFAGEGTLPVGTATRAGGTLSGPQGRRVQDCFACDVALADAILAAGGTAFPVRRADGENGELRLDGGAMIPLWFTLHPLPAPRPGLVIIAPSPAVPREMLVRFGHLLADVARDSGKRVALIASADQGHTHAPDHKRFGFSPAAAQHDALYCNAVKENCLDRLLDISDEMLKESWTDSLWQTLILAGALSVVPMRVDLLSYAVPTYYGMAVAVYEPAT